MTAESREPRPRNSLSLRFKIENQQRAKTTGREQTLPSLIKPLGRSAVGARQRCLAPATSRKRYEGYSYRGQRPGLSIFLFFICFLLLVFRPHTQKLQFCSLLYPQYQQTISPVSEGTTGWRSVLPKKHTTHDGRRRLKHESLPNLFLRVPFPFQSYRTYLPRCSINSHSSSLARQLLFASYSRVNEVFKLLSAICGAFYYRSLQRKHGLIGSQKL